MASRCLKDSLEELSEKRVKLPGNCLTKLVIASCKFITAKWPFLCPSILFSERDQTVAIKRPVNRRALSSNYRPLVAETLESDVPLLLPLPLGFYQRCIVPVSALLVFELLNCSAPDIISLIGETLRYDSGRSVIPYTIVVFRGLCAPIGCRHIGDKLPTESNYRASGLTCRCIVIHFPIHFHRRSNVSEFNSFRRDKAL